jgi:hypothetical protein
MSFGIKSFVSFVCSLYFVLIEKRRFGKANMKIVLQLYLVWLFVITVLCFSTTIVRELELLVFLEALRRLSNFSRQKPDLFPRGEGNLKKDYSRFTRIQCSGSGKTCGNLWCKIKLIGRNNSLVNFNCDLKRPIVKLWVI